MRLALCSDLHVDTWPDSVALDWSSFPAADVLVVAGDVHDDQAGTAAELARAAQVNTQLCLCERALLKLRSQQ